MAKQCDILKKSKVYSFWDENQWLKFLMFERKQEIKRNWKIDLRLSKNII